MQCPRLAPLPTVRIHLFTFFILIFLSRILSFHRRKILNYNDQSPWRR
jgi:hypothetical protein